MGNDNSQPTSPRIADLRRALSAGNDRALADFWARVAREGAPLIEPIADDPEHYLVTLLWRADRPTNNVVVCGGLGRWDIEASQLTYLTGTNLWYRTWREASALRTTYQMTFDDPLTSLIDDLSDERTANWQPDPLNPRRFSVEFPPDPDGVVDGWPVSVIELPDAPTQPWVTPRPDVPTRSVTAHRLASATLGNTRRVWVYTPAGYSGASEPYPTVTLLDGEVYAGVMDAPVTLDNLIASGELPPVVVVMIGSLEDGPGSRASELRCSPAFTGFLHDEVMPWAGDRFNLTDDPARRVIGGASLGGLAAAWAAFSHPESFGNVLAQSGSFWWSPEGDAEWGWFTR